ncbi:hypothetical protein, partial [uncultured Corynebacterium sp.]|uniref:hypothetical protein n=1 Tax=uncultured Corynebacterium sp. TaxID=159447 RepID=UPI0025FEE0A4
MPSTAAAEPMGYHVHGAVQQICVRQDLRIPHRRRKGSGSGHRSGDKRLTVIGARPVPSTARDSVPVAFWWRS